MRRRGWIDRVFDRVDRIVTAPAKIAEAMVELPPKVLDAGEKIADRAAQSFDKMTGLGK